MSDESDYEVHANKKRKCRAPDLSSDSDSSLEIGLSRRPKKVFIHDSSDSDSNSSFDLVHRRKRVGRVAPDTESSSSSGSEINLPKRMPSSRAVLNDSDSSDSDWTSLSESEGVVNKPANTAKPKIEDSTSSDSGDDQAEKCPICLKTFKNQEVGSPESCDHSFCIDCIQEWAKNMNTCPVDRQPFNLILVRKNYNGKFLREIHVETPVQQNDNEEIVEDPTYCEICGRCDGEDRMLLCDGCDLGYHLECLDPPLDNIPTGSWYCQDCGGPEENDSTIDSYEVQLLFEDVQTLGWPVLPRRVSSMPRLIPRTRQSERVRARIITSRRNQERVRIQVLSTLNENQNTSVEDAVNHNERNGPGPSSSGRSRTGVSTLTRRKKKKTKRRYKKSNIRISYEIDQSTGEKIAIKTKIRRKRKRRVNRSRRPVPKTVKKRLAVTLGMCPPRQVVQSLPDVRAQVNTSNNIGFQRSQAGIPTLHLFGQRDELDYFSESEGEVGSSNGINLLIRRRPNMSDAAIMRRTARRKAMALAPPAIGSTNLLDSILDSQTKLHAKNSVLSVEKDGTLKIGKKDGVFNNNNNRINVTDNSNIKIKQTPMYSKPQTNSQSYTSANEYRSESTSSDDRGNGVTTSTSELTGNTSRTDEQDSSSAYVDQPVYSIYDGDKSESKKENKSDNRGTSTNSDSELDIYSDIEVSTSKAEEDEDDFELKPPPTPPVLVLPISQSDEEGNNSDGDLVIDTEKVEEKSGSSTPDVKQDSKEEVSSSADCSETSKPVVPIRAADSSTCYLQSERVQSSSQDDLQEDNDKNGDDDEDLDSEDECPNFSIYSSESLNLARNTDLTLLPNSGTPENSDTLVEHVDSSSTIPEELSPEIDNSDVKVNDSVPKGDDISDNNQMEESSGENKSSNENEYLETRLPVISTQPNLLGGLYSDSDDEAIIKIDSQKPFGISDIRNMTEDISEEERSYTPCLDEKDHGKEGLEGLDTEMISDEDRNDFDESHELKTVSDGDALEINAKESELDFTKPEDYEEGEIVDKLKGKKSEEVAKPAGNEESEAVNTKEVKENTTNKENESNNVEANFKKLSKSNKDRNYRDKDKERSKSKDRKDRSEKINNKKEKRKERRKELERYDVRTIIAEKPRRLKDKFGRDIKRSNSRSSRSLTPPPRKSMSRERRSVSRDRVRKRRPRTRERRSLSKSRTPERRKSPRSNERRRTRSPDRRRSRSRNRKRHRSLSEKRKSRKKSRDRSKKPKKNTSRSRHRSRSGSRRRRNWERERRHSKGRTPSLSRSASPGPRNPSPSWTPPYIMENHQNVRPHNLTVILPNDANKKKKDKKKKTEKRTKDTVVDRRRRRRNDRSPHPSKEVFASGDNILVSVSFNKENEERDISSKRKRDQPEELTSKKARKEKEKRVRERRKVQNQALSTIKPVAIIDLDRSPFKEITPSPKDVIVLTDSENDEGTNLELQTAICDSSQQVVSPETPMNAGYSTGPKTPPEPQVKFSLNSKQPQMRALTNPLIEPDDMEAEEIDPQEELEQRLNDVMHKGPNTPPEPPNSPPSSPDAYDPFDPTKSRSPTPEPSQANAPSNVIQSIEDTEEDLTENRKTEVQDATANQTPDATTHTPPSSLADIQPADSQSSVRVVTPEKSPEHSIGVVINQVVQAQAQTPIFPTILSKTTLSTATYPTSSSITSTSNSTNSTGPRINILSSTILTPASATTLPQRIVLPNIIKSSPIKVSPTKVPIKSSPIKPMPVKTNSKTNPPAKLNRKTTNRNQNGADLDPILDFESPYSPGSSDYEDLFEPPPETLKPSKSKNSKSPVKLQNAFDNLFGSSPVFGTNKGKSKGKHNKNKGPNPKHKIIGIKLDEDHLKILDEVPNSAVEMQVKDKFLKKLNRQERVVEEVKLVLKPHYNKKHINKEEYKDILRRAVPKICHNRSGEINPKKIQHLIEAYVKKIRHSKKVTSSSSVNPQKPIN